MNRGKKQQQRIHPAANAAILCQIFTGRKYKGMIGWKAIKKTHA
jgi:hypothetical protein